ncbi:unnamed protein product, partial [Closterium sp. NIES-64]
MLLQRGVESQRESLKRGAVALQRDFETRNEAVKRGVVSLLWDVEDQSDALKRGLVSLQQNGEAQGWRRFHVLLQRRQQNVDAQGTVLKRGLASLQQDVDAGNEGLKQGVISLQRDMEARNEALKRGMVALQRDVEAQSSALKQGVTVLHRDVEANMLSFQRGAEFWRRVVHLYGSYKVAVSGQSEEEKSATWQRQHERGAEMLYALCTDMKGFFLKAGGSRRCSRRPAPLHAADHLRGAGQFLAKPDLSPPAWVRRLSALHDSPPSHPFLLSPHLPLLPPTITGGSVLSQARPLPTSVGASPLCPPRLSSVSPLPSIPASPTPSSHNHRRAGQFLAKPDLSPPAWAGQFLAKPDLSPPAWVRRLSALHDAAPADPLPLVLQTIQEELGGMGWREVWEWVEEKPLGSASIAQVHRGRLRGGKEVAIKEQHTGAEPLMLTDLANLKAFPAFLQSMEIKAQRRRASHAHRPRQRKPLLPFPPPSSLHVQHAGAKPLMLTDLANLKAFAAFLQSTELNMDVMGALNELEKQSTELNMDVMGALNELEKQSTELNMDVMGALNELEKQIRYEFDFRREAAAMDTIRASLAVMDLIKGSPIVKMGEEMRAKGVNPNGFLATRAKRSIFRSLGAAYGLMILRDGHFQADPHPGNLLICPNRKVALLDYGQTKRLPDSLRLNLARLMLAVADKDMPRVGSLFQALGIRTTRTVFEDPKSFHRMSSLMFDTAVSEGVTTSNPFASESTLKRNGIE